MQSTTRVKKDSDGGWSMRPDVHRNLLIDALEISLLQRHPRRGELAFRSDRSSQYASEDFRQLLEKHGLRASMSRKGPKASN
jgi:putative transposase